MRYIQFKIHASRQGVEQVTALLMANGIYEVSVDDPADMEEILDKKNQYDWDYIDDSLKEDLEREPVVSAYFEDTPENAEKIQHLKLEIMKLKSRELEGVYGWDVDFGRLYAEEVSVDDRDWKDRWKEFFKPVGITDKLVVKPTWEAYTPAAGEKVLELDPGMAFGTGTHETTALCMKLMEKYLGSDCGDKKVLDVGCGSGILSIGAALLGCRQVLAVEIDEDAVQVVRENVAANGVENVVTVQKGDLTEGLDYRADVIAANLMADLVVRLASHAGKHLKAGGVFISSGILTEKRDQTAAAIEKAGFEILEIPEDGMWCAIAARWNGQADGTRKAER